tara:strand:- start:2098 stop:2406 length:309 start_codon:yes stop_codon:yes gene_type:complete
MSENKKFTPGRGKFALKKDSLDDKTSAGVIYTPKENPDWVTGIVAAVGHLVVQDNGLEIPFDIPVGTRVLVTRKDGYDSFGEFMLFHQKSVMAVLDKDTVVE